MTRVTMAGLSAALVLAGVVYAITNSKSVPAGEAVEVFANQAMERAQKARASRSPPGSILWPVTISSSDRDHLESLQIRYQALLYRRGLALGFVTRGAALLLALGVFYLFVKKHEPNQPSEPTAMSVTPPAGQESRQP